MAPPSRRVVTSPACIVLAGLFTSVASCSAQPPASVPDATELQPPAAGDLSSLLHQLHDVQAKVAKLESRLEEQLPNEGVASGGMGMGKQGRMGGGMGMMGMRDGAGSQRGGMGMMEGGMGMMGGGMGMMERGMGMSSMGGMMGRRPGTRSAKMSVPSALPGFPGASHLYHIGETGFFLDHPEHAALDATQQRTLNELKEKALLARDGLDRRIDQAEQELWVLTSSDTPDAAKIEDKVREIEKLRGDQRLSFIRAVGEAAKILTDEQRAALVGANAGETSNGH